VKLTTDFHLLPMLRTLGSVPSFLHSFIPSFVFTAWCTDTHGVTVTDNSLHSTCSCAVVIRRDAEAVSDMQLSRRADEVN
jgi:hypothetical protein